MKQDWLKLNVSEKKQFQLNMNSFKKHSEYYCFKSFWLHLVINDKSR